MTISTQIHSARHGLPRGAGADQKETQIVAGDMEQVSN